MRPQQQPNNSAMLEGLDLLVRLKTSYLTESDLIVQQQQQHAYNMALQEARARTDRAIQAAQAGTTLTSLGDPSSYAAAAINPSIRSILARSMVQQAAFQQPPPSLEALIQQQQSAFATLQQQLPPFIAAAPSALQDTNTTIPGHAAVARIERPEETKSPGFPVHQQLQQGESKYASSLSSSSSSDDRKPEAK